MDPVQCGLPWCPRIGASLSLNVQSISTANMCFLTSDQTLFEHQFISFRQVLFGQRGKENEQSSIDRLALAGQSHTSDKGIPRHLPRATELGVPYLRPKGRAFYPLSFYCLRMATAVSLKALS